MSKLIPLNLIIDNREHKIIQFIQHTTQFTTLIQSKEHIQSLPIGDFHIRLPQNTTDNKENQINHPLVIIERKTISDFVSSIVDGRYKEQIYRLKQFREEIGTRILFLIEGEDIEYVNDFVKTNIPTIRTFINNNKQSKICNYSHITPQAVHSAFINIIIRDNIPILESESMFDTCILLQKILTQCQKKYHEINLNQNNTNNPNKYVNVIKINKKDNITPNVCYINQLSQIPGVSINIAQNIAEKYPSFNDLINAFKECDKPTLMLSNINKIGKILSQRIHTFILFNSLKI